MSFLYHSVVSYSQELIILVYFPASPLIAKAVFTYYASIDCGIAPTFGVRNAVVATSRVNNNIALFILAKA